MTAVATMHKPLMTISPSIFTVSDCQADVMESGARFRVLIAGRRFGKTHLACLELLTKAIERPFSRCWYVAPTHDMAKDIAWDTLKSLVPKQYLMWTPNESTLTIRLKNGSSISLKSADRPDRLRGRGLWFVVLDEFADIDMTVWTAVLRAALSDHMGSALFISTPKGMNWAYDLYARGQQHMAQGSLEWASWQFTTLQGGRVPASEVTAAREDMDSRLFRQEYEASFETLHGRVYHEFLRKATPDGNIDVDADDDGTSVIYVGMDFNVHPMSAVLARKAVDEMIVFASLALPTSSTEEMAAEIRKRYPGRTIVVCPDPSGKARKTSAPVGQTDFTILEQHGMIIHADAAAPPVTDRYNATNAMLCDANGRRRMRVHPRCTELIKTFDGLTYKEGTSIANKKLGLDHMGDACGYLVWQEFNLLHTRDWKTSHFAV